MVSVVALAAFSAQLSGQALLDDLSKRAFAFFWEQTNPVNGLTKDRASNFGGPPPNNVASIASTGYALAADAIGAHRGWVGRREALQRVKTALAFCETRALRDHGWFVHFVDFNTGARVWNSEVSTIDTSILLSGMFVAQGEFDDPEVNRTVNKIVSEIDWKWMLTDGGKKPDEWTICMGSTPEKGFIEARWDALSEEMMLYIQALGAWPEMPTISWAAFRRTPILNYHGRAEVGGGPLFMHEMSQGFLPFIGKRDFLGFDYSVESRNAILNDRQYCIDNPKKHKGYSNNIWGLTACDYPGGYGAFGGPGWGDDDGTVAPTCAIAGVQVTPKESVAAAEAFKAQYPKAYGKYGFSNALNPGQNWIGPDVIGIDLGMMMIGIEDARDGLPQKLSWKSPTVKRGFERAGFHSDESEGSLEQRPLLR